jgi:vacuole morphology and inheritance protein 14
MSDIHDYLDALLPPVLQCFDDPEARVRYYACESLYNIAKVSSALRSASDLLSGGFNN